MDLLILGASARAAAFSAIRIGLRPTCIDLFADADLAASCPVHQVEPSSYPDGLATIALSLPPSQWLYTGAIENRPDLIDRISTKHHLLGNCGEPLRSVRDPTALAEAARESGLVAPGVALDPTGLPVDGSWLRKPLASAGGRGISPWLGRGPRGSAYYQERIEGLPASAIFIGDARQVQCLGMTRQFVGTRRNRFAYCGSLAPWPIPVDVRDQVARLGIAIGSWFGLKGLFGIDLILKDGNAWPIEVNPRYAASVEVLEWALGRSLLAEHLRACGSPGYEGRWSGPETLAAKEIIFADRAFRWPADWAVGAVDPAQFPGVADVPKPGTDFQPGDPVLTVFARGDSPGRCRRALAGRGWHWRRRFRSLAAQDGPSEDG